MVDIARLLIEHGADVNAKTYFEESALIVAQKKGHMNIVKLLKEAGAKE
jgi:ankyrin repeat protein